MRAEYQYLDRVKWLDMYGVDLHHVQVAVNDIPLCHSSHRRQTLSVVVIFHSLHGVDLFLLINAAVWCFSAFAILET